MQVIRQYTVPKNGRLTIDIPPAFDGKQVEVQVVLAEDVAGPRQAGPRQARQPKKRGKKQVEVQKKTTGLEKLVGSLSHLTPEQNEKIDREFAAMRDEWERPIF